ncbi:MAG TPA: dihydrolipoamide acetyltransferase family protein [Solirubrobacteraceae bacterium]|jgi:pyruvate dehydrogenase E2 component (dihydrolipoamide acetyltransferase)|nr:dihydrolipoamide acetyltransferase family protein [Solirubrobacteraceae bacterium]
MSEIVMPRLSDTMEEGTVLRWLKRDGEHVRRGEELVEIETDKAAMVYESDQEGALRIVAQEGDTLAVGATIAHVGAAADAVEPPSAEPPSAAGAAPLAVETAIDAPGNGGEGHGSPEHTSIDAVGHEGEDRVKASPLARRIAHESGVDLHTLTGTGPGGRIVKADVEAVGAAAGTRASGVLSGRGTQVPESGGPPTGAGTAADIAERVATAKGETTIVELTRTQQTIARRMAESKATIPDFSLQVEIDMERCVELRAELKRLSPEEAPTYNDMVVKACALALHEHPRANGSYRDGRLQLHARVNVGVAVAVSADGDVEASGTAGSLVVPTVFDAALKSLGEIARETRALAERVRAGTITPPELGGGTFTVSNLGMYGIRSFSAIVNPPQAAILSVGSLALRAVVLAGGADGDGKIVARHTMAVTLVCDHRILYGADAARFLARVRELLEEPAALAL